MKKYILQITSGFGPIEVCEFVALLALQLREECDREGAIVLSASYFGEERTPRSVELLVEGRLTSALLALAGTHVLVAKSEKRGRKSRKRWYAGVGVHDYSADQSITEIPQSEIEVKAARAGGPGGQHVNTTASAVRVRHKPSGISVRVASERSQMQNRRLAVIRLREILGEREARRKASDSAKLRKAHYQFERGRPVRKWRLEGAALRAIS